MVDIYRQLVSEGDPDRPEPGSAYAPAPDAIALADRARLELSDMGNAERLRRAFGRDVIYVNGKGWAVRDGQRYSFRQGEPGSERIGKRLAGLVRAEAKAAAEMDVSEFQAARYLKIEQETREPGKRRFHDAEGATRQLPLDLRDSLLAHAKKCENKAAILNALHMLRSDVLVDIEALDADPWSFTVTNGRLDLRAVAEADLDGASDAVAAEVRKGWLTEQDWTAWPTKCAGVAFDPEADCPAWRDFLALVQPDEAVRDFLQRCAGLLVFGRNEAQACILLRGGGGNGKSTLTDILQHVLGEVDGYAVATKVEMFLVTREAAAGQASPEEVDLPGARGMFASEPAATDTFSAKKIKAMTGGDRRPVRGLFKENFWYTPRATPWISFNRTPRIKDEDEGTRRRLFFINFDVELHKLPVEQRRKPQEVQDELRGEGAGILNWILDGFRAWRREGLNPPESVSALKDELMAEADPVGRFMEDCFEADAEARLQVSDLHKAFLAWADETGASPWSNKALNSIMTEKGWKKTKRSAWFWIGPKWREDDFARAVRARAEAGEGYRPADAPASSVSDEDADAFDAPPF